MGTLYENLKALCAEKGITGGKMCVDLGLSKSLMSDLKAGRRTGVNANTLSIIADYFGVSVDRILGTEKAAPEDGEIANALELLRSRPETRALLEATRGMSKEDVEKMANMIRAFRGGNG